MSKLDLRIALLIFPDAYRDNHHVYRGITKRLSDRDMRDRFNPTSNTTCIMLLEWVKSYSPKNVYWIDFMQDVDETDLPIPDAVYKCVVRIIKNNP